MSRQDPIPITPTAMMATVLSQLIVGLRRAYGLRFKTPEFFWEWAVEYESGEPNPRPPKPPNYSIKLRH